MSEDKDHIKRLIERPAQNYRIIIENLDSEQSIVYRTRAGDPVTALSKAMFSCQNRAIPPKKRKITIEDQ